MPLFGACNTHTDPSGAPFRFLVRAKPFGCRNSCPRSSNRLMTRPSEKDQVNDAKLLETWHPSANVMYDPRRLQPLP